MRHRIGSFLMLNGMSLWITTPLTLKEGLTNIHTRLSLSLSSLPTTMLSFHSHKIDLDEFVAKGIVQSVVKLNNIIFTRLWGRPIPTELSAVICRSCADVNKVVSNLKRTKNEGKKCQSTTPTIKPHFWLRRLSWGTGHKLASNVRKVLPSFRSSTVLNSAREVVHELTNSALPGPARFVRDDIVRVSCGQCPLMVRAVRCDAPVQASCSYNQTVNEVIRAELCPYPFTFT